MDFEKLAETLRTFVRERLGRDVPVVKTSYDETKAPDTILWWSYSGGDPYSGHTTSTNLSLTLTRPEHSPFKVEFWYLLHELSGQVDQWEVRIDGATPAEVDALGAIFSPAQNPDHWNNHVGPALFVDGKPASFPTRS